jgi:hypothetical protein
MLSLGGTVNVTFVELSMLAMRMYILGVAAKQGFADTTLGKASFLVLTAILGFVSAWVLAQLNRKKEPYKQISWDMDVERGLVAVNPSIRERVQVLYKNKPIDNLYAVRFRASNTGNQVIKNQYIRFEFSPLTSILDEGPDPLPPRELGVEQARTSELSEHETRYVIKHLERSQEVSFLFVVAGKDAGPPIPYPLNDEGNVDFIPRDAARVTEDIEHVQPFVFWTFFFLFIPSVFTSTGYFGIFSDAFVTLLRIVLLIPILPHIWPIARLAQRCISRFIAEVKTSQEIRISGGESFAFLSENSTLNGDISFGSNGNGIKDPLMTQDDSATTESVE